MSDEDQRLAQGLSISAEDLEHRGWPRSGLLRQGARRIVELSTENERLRERLREPLRSTVAGTGCVVCGRPIEQKKRGRPRTYCSDACKADARKSRNGQMAA